MSDTQQELEREVTEKLGDTPSVKDVIEHLVRGGAITNKTMRNHMVRQEFFAMMRNKDKTAYAIEEELAEKYGKSPDWVRWMRLSKIV